LSARSPGTGLRRSASRAAPGADRDSPSSRPRASRVIVHPAQPQGPRSFFRNAVGYILAIGLPVAAFVNASRVTVTSLRSSNAVMTAWPTRIPPWPPGSRCGPLCWWRPACKGTPAGPSSRARTRKPRRGWTVFRNRSRRAWIAFAVPAGIAAGHHQHGLLVQFVAVVSQDRALPLARPVRGDRPLSRARYPAPSRSRRDCR